MTKTILAPHKYDVVGSFLRPANLKKAREDFKKGSIASDDLKKVEDEAIKDLVEKQKEAGLKIISDGEFRRSWWHYDFFWGLNGIEQVELEDADVIHFHGASLRPEGVKIVGKISGKNHPFLDHYKFVAQFADEDHVAKQTLPAPAQLLRSVYTQIGPDGEVYKSEEDFINDVAKAYGEFFQDLYDLGCRNVQIDDCTWGALVDPDAIAKYEADGKSVEDLKATYLEINNRALEQAPKDLNITTHICRGNYRSAWHFQGGYEAVADYVLAQEKVSAFYLEYDDDRSGDFEALKKVPQGTKVVLGLVTSKRPNLEDPDQLLKRIQEASQYVPLENLAISPQCGFSSTEEGNALTEEDQWKKIKLCREVAEKAFK